MPNLQTFIVYKDNFDHGGFCDQASVPIMDKEGFLVWGGSAWGHHHPSGAHVILYENTDDVKGNFDLFLSNLGYTRVEKLIEEKKQILEEREDGIIKIGVGENYILIDTTHQKPYTECEIKQG